MINRTVVFVLMFFISAVLFSQDAVITETEKTFKTYPFGDPDPVPRMSRIYPYFRFDGYSHKAHEKKWQVIRMENRYIQLDITPEIGGKIWGAIEKSTGEAFIYYNKVVKFRDIAMRGAWTSGGIEYNFGAIGHAPPCATPVDYVYRKNKDGSVSCFLGGMDLPSRTQWRVHVKLPKDTAYFETECTWYNPSPLHRSYYHWMNAAADASDDLEFHYPGAFYIGHDGSKHQWPYFESKGKKRTISNYRENRFGSHKSYHVMGVYTEHFGGYYHGKKFGFGNWSLYDDKPGKKLWLWALSRQGGIWEDLLTDKGNNQYIEFQSGRLLNQAAAESSGTRYKHALFQPHAFDRWEEIWFPFKDTGGMTQASPYGVLNVEMDSRKKTLSIALCALRVLDDTVQISFKGENGGAEKILYNKKISLLPMGVFKDTIDISRADGGPFTIDIGEGKMSWSSDEYESKRLRKYVGESAIVDPAAAEGLFIAAKEEMRQRRYQAALKLFKKCIKKEPAHIPAMTGLAEIHYRESRYDAARKLAKNALDIDAYDAGANFVYALASIETGKTVEAKEALGWAARSMAYRSAAYTEMAAVYLREKTYQRTRFYAWKALDYNRFNIRARHILTLANKKLKREKRIGQAIDELLEINPLDALARYETSLFDTTTPGLSVRGELPHETYLELAIEYAGYGLEKEALAILQSAPSHAMVHYWRAFLSRHLSKEIYKAHLDKALDASPGFVFPFRNESIPVLQWANKQQRHWKTLYYLALIHWKNHNLDDAGKLFASCQNQPANASFYIARANFMRENRNEGDKAGDAVKRQIIEDYRRATRLAPEQWRAWQALANYYEHLGQHKPGLETAGKAYNKFPDSYIIALDYARHLLNSEKFIQCLSVLKKTHVLPYEGAREGRNIYRKANLMEAVNLILKGEFKRALTFIDAARLWPEHLGVGKPYDPDQTPENYLQDLCKRKNTGSKGLAKKIQGMVKKE